MILAVAEDEATHWRYAIYAARCLRTLIRRDSPVSPDHLHYFLEKVRDNHPSLRYYAQRALMKTARYIKLRTFARSATDLVLEKNNNPLKCKVDVPVPSHKFTADFLEGFRQPIDPKTAPHKPTYCEKLTTGWVAWSSTLTMYLPPYPTKSSLKPWETDSEDAITEVRNFAADDEWWKDVSVHYSSETHSESVSSDNISTVKSIVQLLEGESFEALQTIVEELVEDPDQNKQRGAAEFLAGLVIGAKHWPADSQDRLWKWAMPVIQKAFSQRIKTDTLPIWTSFLEYVFYNRDPRRHQTLVDYILREFEATDYNGESSLVAVKALSFLRAFYEDEGRKFVPWADDIVRRVWPEIHSDHDEVRAYISEMLTFTNKIKWEPKPSIPSAEVFVRECRTTPVDIDIMGMRGSYHKDRVQELVKHFPTWRAERLPGARAFQSNYDRVGTTVCRWLYQSVHDTNAISAYDYIVPLLPELFRFTEAVLDVIFDTIQNSPSWKVRLQAMPLVQVFYFRQVPLISEAKVTEILEVLCKCLDDEVVEVREMAATTLSGVLRLSSRRSILTLKNRFLRLLNRSHLPERKDPAYNAAIRQRHAAILGICALVDSYPYTVERWMPELLTNVLAEHTYDPVPISTTVQKCASNFKKTHQDTWHEDSKRFTEDQLTALSTLLTGSSYYA
ncbi:hypothetical protein EWM64_g270 [Hericium alpestre]|uniref:Uncharacterized protein n=1 Tax=Hericium alpestre TaxID=135208 RepID=A0A4Z0ACC4_9AGAM|nr:hypothetical protein EWM64_g270 [Hericium alpestre]